MPQFCDDLALERPTEIAVRDDRTALGWVELGQLLNQLAQGLRAVDLGPERRLAVFADNAIETGAVHLAGMLAGVSTVPVNFHFTSEELSHILTDSAARLVFVGPLTVDRALAACAALPGITVIGWRCEPRSGLVAFEQWIERQRCVNPTQDVRPLPHLLYTSGTTGVPKGTDLPPAMFSDAQTITEHLVELANRPGAGLGPHLVVGPMYHTGPLSGFRLLATGTPVVILGRFDARATLEAISEYRIATSVMVPTHFVRLLGLDSEIREGAEISSLRMVFHTGAACPIEVKRAMIEWWGPVLVEDYGATEVGSTCRIISEEWLSHPGSVGRGLAPFEPLVLDENDQPVPVGTVGRLFFRDKSGRGVIYRNDPEKSAGAHVRPGVFTLGELGRVDAEGYVYITERSADLVLSGGVNIYPIEAETALLRHPRVFDAACVGIPDTEMGERLIALVVPTDPSSPPDPEELIETSRETIARYKCPREVVFVDTVQRNAMGKINRRRLRESLLKSSES